MNQPGLIRDDYAGPGGWTRGLQLLDLTDVGIEWDRHACATRAAAGYHTIRADLAQYRTSTKLWGYIASPPCQTFSVAGGGDGRAVIRHLVKIVHDGGWTQADAMDDRTRHVIDVARNCDQLDTDWICLEQVPPVLPIWEAIAHRLRARGYSVWCGVLNSANYGVPQTRKRAVLIASRLRTVSCPPATHAEHPQPDLFGPALEHWISMAEALGWNGWAPTLTDKARSWLVEISPVETPVHIRPRALAVVLNPGMSASQTKRRTYELHEPAPTLAFGHDAASWCWEYPAPTVTGGGTEGGGVEVFGNAEARQKVRESWAASHPAPTVTGGRGGAAIGGSRVRKAMSDGWPHERPATTIAGDARCWPPGHEVNQGDRDRLGEAEANDRYGDRAGTEAIRLEIEEALVLQSFPADHPVAGTRSAQFQQVGNAIPPLLARAIVSEATGHPIT